MLLLSNWDYVILNITLGTHTRIAIIILFQRV